MAKEQTWKKQGKKEMVQIGVEDKHAIIFVVSCITNGNLIPFQSCLPLKTTNKSFTLALLNNR
jgi:hypothetical protein